MQPKRRSGDRTTRDARYAVELGQVAELVQPPKSAYVEEHRPVAAARQAQGDFLLKRPVAVVEHRGPHVGGLGKRAQAGGAFCGNGGSRKSTLNDKTQSAPGCT